MGGGWLACPLGLSCLLFAVCWLSFVNLRAYLCMWMLPIRPCRLLSRHRPYSCERIARGVVTETNVSGWKWRQRKAAAQATKTVAKYGGTQKPRAFSTSDGFLFEHHNHIFCILSCLCSLFVAVSVLAIMIKLSKNKMRKFLQYEQVRWWAYSSIETVRS